MKWRRNGIESSKNKLQLGNRGLGSPHLLGLLGRLMMSRKLPILQVHHTLLFQFQFGLSDSCYLDISQLQISPQRKRKQGRVKDLIPFKALMTYYTPKSPGDPWTLVQSPHPVNVTVANWKPGVRLTGWLGEGSLQRAIYVSMLLSSGLACLTPLKGSNCQCRVCISSAQIKWCKFKGCRRAPILHTPTSWCRNRMGKEILGKTQKKCFKCMDSREPPRYHQFSPS